MKYAVVQFVINIPYPYQSTFRCTCDDDQLIYQIIYIELMNKLKVMKEIS
jgi:hypothetical protein